MHILENRSRWDAVASVLAAACRTAALHSSRAQQPSAPGKRHGCPHRKYACGQLSHKQTIIATNQEAATVAVEHNNAKECILRSALQGISSVLVAAGVRAAG